MQQKLSQFGKEGGKTTLSGCEQLIQTYPLRLEAATVAKDAATNTDFKRKNTWAINDGVFLHDMIEV